MNDDEDLRLPSSTIALPMDDVQELSIDDDFDIHKLIVFREVHVVGQNARALVSDDVDEREELVLLEDHTFEFHQNHAHYSYFFNIFFVPFKGLDPDPKSVAQTPRTFPL